MSNDESPPGLPRKGCKTLPLMELELDVLPPMLRLDMQLRPGADVASVTPHIEAFLDGLSGHYQTLGGMGLHYYPKQLAKVSPDGVLRIILYPLESEDVHVQQDRLQRILEALRGGTRHDRPSEVVRLDAEVKLKAG
jgi:hypothetical protein